MQQRRTLRVSFAPMARRRRSMANPVSRPLLARHAGVSLDTILRAEHGTGDLTVSTLVECATALGTPMVELFEVKR